MSTRPSRGHSSRGNSAEAQSSSPSRGRGRGRGGGGKGAVKREASPRSSPHRESKKRKVEPTPQRTTYKVKQVSWRLLIQDDDGSCGTPLRKHLDLDAHDDDDDDENLHSAHMEETQRSATLADDLQQGAAMMDLSRVKV